MKHDRISSKQFNKKESKRCMVCTKNTTKNKNRICDDCKEKGYVAGNMVSFDSHG